MAGPKQNKQLRAQAADRVRWLWEQSGEPATDFAARMGTDYKTFKAGLDRRSFALHHLMLLAQSLNLTLDFICGLTDEPARISKPEKRPDFWQMRSNISGNDGGR